MYCYMNTSFFYCCYYVEEREKKESTTNDKSAGENLKNKGNVNCSAHCTRIHVPYNGYFSAALFCYSFCKCYDYPFHEYK